MFLKRNIQIVWTCALLLVIRTDRNAFAQTETDLEIMPALQGKGEIWSALALSPNEQFLATGSKDGYVKVWDIPRGQQVRTWSPSTDVQRVINLNFSWNNQFLVAVYECRGVHGKWGCESQSGKYTTPNSVAILDITSGTILQRVREVGMEVYSAALAPDGKILAIAGMPTGELNATGGALALWDLKTQSRLYRGDDWDRERGHTYGSSPTWVYGFSTDGRFLLGITFEDDTARLYELKQNGKSVKNRRVSFRRKHLIGRVNVSQNQQLFASVWFGGTIEIHNLQTKKRIGVYEYPKSSLAVLTFGTHGDILVGYRKEKDVGTIGKVLTCALYVKQIDVQSGQEITFSPLLHPNYSPNSTIDWQLNSFVIGEKYTLAILENGALGVWSTQTGLLRATLLSSHTGQWAAFTPENQWTGSTEDVDLIRTKSENPKDNTTVDVEKYRESSLTIVP